MAIQKLFDPEIQKKPMSVAGFMSGSGTNIIKIIEYQINYREKMDVEPPYKVVLLFSDRTDFKKCRISEISKKYNIPFETNDIREFYRKRGYIDRRNLEVRKEYDQKTLEFLKNYKVDCVALCGYMSIVTNVIFDNYPTINVHPSDLSIMNKTTGRRKYIGEHAVLDAILAGEKYIKSSTHIATAEVDGGPVLLISEPVEIVLPENLPLEDLKKEKNKEILNDISDAHQNKLKEMGDWVIFPKILELIAKGLVEKDDNNNYFINGSPAPLKL